MKKVRSVVVYEGDEFEYMYTEDGEIKITKHVPSLSRIDKDKIVAAYAVTTMADGSHSTTIKTMTEIRQAWMQGATRGNSPAHRNFTSEMAGRTVERSAMKHIINSSSDAWLLSEDEKERRVTNETGGRARRGKYRRSKIRGGCSGRNHSTIGRTRRNDAADPYADARSTRGGNRRGSPRCH